MKKKKVVSQNYLEQIPRRPDAMEWTTDEAGIVTLAIPNTGWVNKLAQKFFKKPPISYVHLDTMGSFIWPIMDGEKSILDLGELVEQHFGEEAHPLYERLAKYFMILDSYHFVEWVTKE